MYICGTSYYHRAFTSHTMFLGKETSRAKKMLKKAHDVHRRGKRQLASYLFAIARRAIRYAREYDRYDTNRCYYHISDDKDMTGFIDWKEIYLCEQYGLFKHFCKTHGL